MKLVVFEIGAEEGGLGAGVCERYAHVADHRGLVLVYAQLGGALLEHNLDRNKTEMVSFSSCGHTCRWRQTLLSYRIIVANQNQVLVLPTSDRAFVQRVNDAHVRLLLEA